jgi:hypothetical protein
MSGTYAGGRAFVSLYDATESVLYDDDPQSADELAVGTGPTLAEAILAALEKVNA